MEHCTRRLAYDPPYDWAAALTFLERRAVDGVEKVESGTYRRSIQYNGLTGTLEVRHDEPGQVLLATVRNLPPDAIHVAIERVRWMFDLDADLREIRTHLGRDPAMAPLIASRPAVRVLRGWHGFEVAARSVIGQQVTVARARRLNGRLVERCGGAIPEGIGADGLRHLFPTAQQVLDAELSAMGMPGRV